MNTFFYTNPVHKSRVAKIVTDLTVDQLTKMGVFDADTKFIVYNNEIDHDLEIKFFDTIQFDDETNPSTVLINIDHARSMRFEELRTQRNSVLSLLDNETVKYITNQTILDAISADKDILRDLPENIDLSNITDPRDLLNVSVPELDIDYCGKYKSLLTKSSKKSTKQS